MKLTGTLPWTKSCFVCGEANPHGFGLRMQVRDGHVTLDYRTRPTDVGYRQLIHGGVLSTLMDETMAWASIVASRRLCVAAELSLRLRNPAHAGETIHVDAWTTRTASRLVLTEGVITGETGREILRAQGKYLPMSGEQEAISAEDFVAHPDALDPRLILGDAD
ncbi:MAG: PaaI family thioesterase [Kiritimatiellae bacterium]|nr:PaaI family thioesterase [Kiritimatiellia bacterium]